MSLWKKIDQIDLTQNTPYLLSKEDECYYARDYISKGGYQSSEANQLIFNFKKDVSKRGTEQWKYKLRAIAQFAKELNDVLGDNTVVAHIPSSKAKSDPAYDSRFSETLERLRQLNSSIVVVEPFVSRESLPAVHNGGERKISAFYDNLEWLGLDLSVSGIVLIDDVITSGAHFKACQNMLTEKVPGIKVCGVFWAKTIWPNPPAIDFSDFPGLVGLQ